MRKALLIVLAAQLSGCATPRGIRDLAQSTGPFIAETQGSASAVQRRFVQQDAAVGSRITWWNDNAAADSANAEITLALWAIDSGAGGSKGSQAKANLLFLDRIRAGSQASIPKLIPAPTEDTNAAMSSAKLIVMLDGIAKNKLMTVGTVSAWIQATDKALADLKKDAEAKDAK